MKKATKTAILLLPMVYMLMALPAKAAPVDVATAQKAATNHLKMQHLTEKGEPLHWAATYRDTEQNDCFYVFNVGNRGFVLVGADDRCTPILGFSPNGIWRSEQIPDNFAYLLESYRSSISEGIRNNIAPIPEHLEEWNALIHNDDSFYAKRGSKSVETLLSTTWSQGYGCNEYTPQWNGTHVVVGCVALAMAQIMHYHGYPTHGYGDHSYYAEYYGQQSADFYNSTYDHTLMPDDFDYYDVSQDQIDATSLFCYHCGVAVNMHYENPYYTEGSGAHTSDVPKGLRYFGYFRARRLMPLGGTEQGWHDVLRPQLDAHLPIYMSGVDGGGHAFVCDGYNSNTNRYHFNYGWGGWCDGDYTLQTMLYGASLEAIGDITPSYLESHSSTLHMAPDAASEGDGSCWEQAAGNFGDVIAAASLTSVPIWMKEGTYYGDTAESFAFTVPKGTKMYGGFAGTEDSLEQRDIDLHPTILDGGGAQGVMSCISTNPLNTHPSSTLVSGFTLTHGNQDHLSALDLAEGATAEWMTIRDNVATFGDVVGVYSGTLQLSKIYGNESDSKIISVTDGKIKNNLIAQNRSQIAVDISEDAMVLENTIVNNSGTAVRSASSECTISGNILWSNDSTIQILTETAPKIVYCHIESDTTPDPLFVAPLDSTHRGYGAEMGDYHLQQGSPCIDQGEKSKAFQTRMDLDGRNRFINGRSDQGCYESDYPIGIEQADSRLLFATYPNPTHDILTIRTEGLAEGSLIQLYNAMGSMIIQHILSAEEAEADAATLSLRGLPTGLYVLKAGGHSTKIVVR